MTEQDIVGKFSEKDISDYMNKLGAKGLADKCVEVTNHVQQLTKMMGEVMREEAMACIIGEIEVHVVCYGAGNKIFEAKLGKQTRKVALTKEDYKVKPETLDQDLCFNYRGYNCELCSCNSIIHTEQILGLTKENIHERFPRGIFSDKYVCFIYGHKDEDGRTKEDYADPDDWCPKQYLVPDAWLYGAEMALEPGKSVDKYILRSVDKFLEEHGDI